jgi:hypothetical protein
MLNIPTTENTSTDVLLSKIADNNEIISMWIDGSFGVTEASAAKAAARIAKYEAEIAIRGGN